MFRIIAGSHAIAQTLADRLDLKPARSSRPGWTFVGSAHELRGLTREIVIVELDTLRERRDALEIRRILELYPDRFTVWEVSFDWLEGVARLRRP